ncbi:MAG TPA: hypothetical protein VGN16_12610 [Acidobacteriaceae bacterium]|jgi:Tol biopolymer transport system component
MFSSGQKSAVRDHLKRVLVSSEFARSERAAAFLRFIVEQTLEEADDSLKERAIGIAVFDRAADWDPKLDTTVRTEARRVRQKLTDYYLSPAGEGEAVRIEVPRGAYVPNFRFHAPALEAPATSDPDKPVESTFQPTSDLPARRPPAFANWRILAWIPVLACFSIAVILVSNHARTSAQSQLFETVPFTTEYGHALSPGISPDGSQIAYVWDKGKGEYRIYLKAVASGPARRLTSAEATELDPAWSPDGKRIAFLRVADSGTDVVVRDIAEGTERTIGAIATQIGDWTGDPGPLIGNLGPAWTADQQDVIVSDGFPHTSSTGLVRIRVADGARQQLTTVQGSAHDFLPRISPDGNMLAFTRAISHGISDIYLLDMKTGQSRRLTNEARSVNGIAWSKEGNRLIFSSNREGPFQLWTMGVADGAIRKLNTDSTTAIDPQIVPKANWLAFVTTNQNWNIDRIKLAAGNAAEPERLIASSGRNHSAHYSPDGRHVAFVSDRSGAWEIWLCEAICAEPQKLTEFHGPWIGGLSWSPDSRQLAFDARPGRNSAIYRLSIANPSPQLVEQNAFEERMPSWSGDGKSLYFNSDRDGSVSIWKRDLATNAIRKISEGFTVREISPDGTVLVGHSDGTIWRVPAGSLVPFRIAGDVVADPVLAWTTVGDTLYYCVSTKGGAAQLMQYSGWNARVIGKIPVHSPPTSASIDVSPDGHTLLMTQVDQSSSGIYRRIGNIP